MRNYNMLTISLVITFLSCNSPKDKLPNIKKLKADIVNYTGNALVFYNEDICGNRLYLIRVDELDSNKFKNDQIGKFLNNALSIQISIDHEPFFALLNDKNKRLLLKKSCGIPYDSMYYSRVFISYRNYHKILMYKYDKYHNYVKARDDDSCNTKAITETDSSELRSFHIYPK
jgi:hypothetical protein